MLATPEIKSNWDITKLATPEILSNLEVVMSATPETPSKFLRSSVKLMKTSAFNSWRKMHE